MKRREHLPDFHQLCAPEQHDTAHLISQLIFFFFLTAVGGFLWEVMIFLIKEGQFRNRGFLYGPWLPVYGVGAVLFYLLLADLKNHPIAVFFLSSLIGTGLELVIGWFLDAVWGLRYWDYSGYMFQFRGYICLWSALGFGVAGVLWICLLSRFLTRLWLRLPDSVCRAVNTLLVLLFILDCAAALIFPNIGVGITFS